MKNRAGVTVACLIVAMSALGCSRGYHHSSTASGPEIRVSKDVRHRHGPPPHAPAHGYRHKHRDGVDLRFDSGLGVYAVIGHRDTWFLDDVYVRWTKGTWQSSVRIQGEWGAVAVEELPKSLRDFKKKNRKNKRK